MMTRDEHIKWCKDRAMAEFKYYKMAVGLKEGIRNGLTSMMSDIRKHPETQSETLQIMCLNKMSTMQSEAEFKTFIGAFN